MTHPEFACGAVKPIDISAMSAALNKCTESVSLCTGSRSAHPHASVAFANMVAGYFNPLLKSCNSPFEKKFSGKS
jgi:hypothetical protein